MGDKVCHIEFVAGDLAAAGEFYSNVFGWKITPMGDNYALWCAGDENVGGGFTLEDESSGGQRTVAYIKVDDIEAKLTQITGAGGELVVPKTKISDEHGFFALFKDHSGTIVGLWGKA